MLKSTAFHAPVIIAALLLPVTCAAQAAQGEVRRPYRALFGGDPNDTTASSFSVNLMGAYDDNVRPTHGVTADPRFDDSGYLGGASASLILQRSGEKASFSLGASSSFRYYAAQQEFQSAAHGAFAQAGFRPGNRTSVQFRGGFMWAPLYSPLLSSTGFGGDSINPAAPLELSGDYASSIRPATFTTGGADASHALTRRASLKAGYSFHRSDYTEEGRSQRSDSVRAGGSYRVTRYSSLQLNYSRTMYRLDTGAPRRDLHDFSGGIDYRRPLSFSGRRTTFTVTPGWALSERRGSLRLHASGSATLEHEIGRTWTAKAVYRRGIRFVDGVDAELLANSATAGVEGLLTRSFSLSLGTQMVVSDKTGGTRDYTAYAGSVRGSYALSRNVSAYAQYIYFSYRFGDGMILPATVGRRLDRQGVRVGISLWTPILR